jgi:methylenetetrahydrofolate dehydrogenase (NADP+)/methenyltetrahydrofolate cyclohydrolase
LAKLLQGRIIAKNIKDSLRSEIGILKERIGLSPVLASIQIGENAGAAAYVKAQQKAADSLGLEYRLCKLEKDLAQDKLIRFIQDLNRDAAVNGIILQMPLPPQVDYRKMSEFILPQKDVEGLHPANMGKIIFAKAKITPCTPQAVMELLKATGVNLYGKEVVIIGHSEIVGKPLSLLLLDKFATTCLCHIGTSQAGRLEEHIKRAEVLIVAVGKAGLVKGNWIKQGAIVIDVGINRVGDKIVGDVEFEEAARRASFITPVPGGVGPLTVTMLMKNLVEAFKLQHSLAG